MVGPPVLPKREGESGGERDRERCFGDNTITACIQERERDMKEGCFGGNTIDAKERKRERERERLQLLQVREG